MHVKLFESIADICVNDRTGLTWSEKLNLMHDMGEFSFQMNLLIKDKNRLDHKK